MTEIRQKLAVKARQSLANERDKILHQSNQEQDETRTIWTKLASQQIDVKASFCRDIACVV